MGRKNTKKKGGDTDRDRPNLDNSGFNEEDDEDVQLQMEETKQNDGKFEIIA